jgi:mono/diheme cytochrome c family protein
LLQVLVLFCTTSAIGPKAVEGPGHCADCHSPRNLLGGIEKSKDFAGGAVDGWLPGLL